MTIEMVDEVKPKRGRKPKEATEPKETTVEAENTNSKETVKASFLKTNPSTKKTVRKRVIIDEDQYEAPDPKNYEVVKFIFFNEEQKDVPVPYEWVDKWVKLGQCKGMFYHGQTYELPRIAFDYYKNECREPIRSNVEEEIVPGKPMLVSKVTGWKYRFRMQEIS